MHLYITYQDKFDTGTDMGGRVDYRDKAPPQPKLAVVKSKELIIR